MDFIEGKGQPQQAAPAPPAQQMEQMIPAGPPQQGLPAGTGLSQVEQAPSDYPDEPASPEEQKQHDDLFLRIMSAVHDIRTPPNGRKSMADQVIETMSNKDNEPEVSIGETAGLLMRQMVTMAKRQDVKYSPDVVREVGTALVFELYEIADKSGAIENLPAEGSNGYDAITQQAAYEAVKSYGEDMIKTGEADQQGRWNDLQHQMQREADSGELDEWGMEEFDDKTRLSLARKVGDVTNGRP